MAESLNPVTRDYEREDLISRTPPRPTGGPFDLRPAEKESEMDKDLCRGQGAEPVAHIPCDEDHGAASEWLAPHCAACGDPLPEPAVVQVTLVSIVEVTGPAAPEPVTEAIGIVLRLAEALDGMTVEELEPMYGEDLAEVMADAMAWATMEG